MTVVSLMPSAQSMPSPQTTITLPIHKSMLPYLDEEGVTYMMVAVSIAFVDLVYIEVSATAQHVQGFLHAGIRIGKACTSYTQSPSRA